MKRIICLLLALTCVFALFSCGDKELASIIELIDKSEPTRIVTHTQVTYGAETPLSGRFVTVIDGNNSTTEYRYERNAVPGVDVSDEPIMEVAGTVYYKDGMFSEDGETWKTESPDMGAMLVKFVFTEKSVSNYTIKDGNLTATLTPDEAAEIFGKTFENIKDNAIVLTIVTNGTFITGETVQYTVLDGETEAEVFVETSYTYVALPGGDGESADGGEAAE